MQMRLTSLLCALLGLGVTAAEKPPRDFSAGFEKLCALARIPDLSQAEPGYIERLEWTRVGHWSRDLGRRPAEGAASSWKLGENPDGSLRILLDGWLEISLYPLSEKDPTRLRGTWRRGAPRKIGRALGDAATAWQKRQRKGTRGDGEEGVKRGGALLFGATFLFAAGHRRQANEIATALLGLDNARHVLAQSYQTAANRAYHGAFMAFITTNDRETFLRALADIAARFPEGWDRLPIVRRIHEELRVPGAPPDTDVMRALPKRDRQLLAELMRAGPCEVLPDMHGWLFVVPSELVYAQHDTALRRLLEKGTDALPLIIALAEDRRPTRYLDLGSDPTGYLVLKWGSYWGESDDDGNPSPKQYETTWTLATADDRAHMGLPHWVDGRELAKLLLRTAWRGPDGTAPGTHAPDLEDLVDEARAWHTRNQGTDRLSLAWKMLDDPEARWSAITFLLAGPPTEGEYPVVEAAIRKLPVRAMHETTAWLTELRGEKARPHLRLAAAAGRFPSEWHEYDVGAGRGMMNLLPIEGETEALGEFRAALLASRGAQLKKKTWYVLMGTADCFVGNDLIAGELLREAATSVDRDRQSSLLGLLSDTIVRPWQPEPRSPIKTLRWERLDSFLEEHPTAEGKQVGATRDGSRGSLKLDLARYGAFWRSLLADQRPPDLPSLLLPPPLASGPAYDLFLRMYAPPSAQETVQSLTTIPGSLFCMPYTPPVQRVLGLLPGGVDRQLWERVHTLLANPAARIDRVPDPAAVPPERVIEIATELAGLRPEQAQKKALALPDAEILAFMDLLGKDEALRRGLLADLRRQLPSTCTLVGAVPEPVRQFVAGLTGQRLSSQLAERMVKEGKELARRGYCFAVVFEAGTGMGAHLVARSLEPSPADGWDPGQVLDELAAGWEEGTVAKSTVEMELHVSPLHHTAHWPLQKQSEPALDRDKVPDDLDMDLDQDRPDSAAERKQLLQALDSLPKKELTRLHGSIRFGIVGINQETWNRLQAKADK